MKNAVGDVKNNRAKRARAEVSKANCLQINAMRDGPSYTIQYLESIFTRISI
jgi:hypothetical protein